MVKLFVENSCIFIFQFPFRSVIKMSKVKMRIMLHPGYCSRFGSHARYVLKYGLPFLHWNTYGFMQFPGG